MRRGPGGGLFVVPPSVAPIADVAAVYLKRHGVEVAHFGEVRVGVELALADLLIERQDEEAEAVLHAALAAEEDATPAEMAEVVHDLHAVIASLRWQSDARAHRPRAHSADAATRGRTPAPRARRDPEGSPPSAFGDCRRAARR